MTTTVVNKKGCRGDAYIGRRPYGMHFGNPFTHRTDTLASVRVKTRDEAIQRYRTWLEGKTDQDVEPERRAWILEHLPELKDKRLACFCKPLACHGDVLVAMVDVERS